MFFSIYSLTVDHLILLYFNSKSVPWKWWSSLRRLIPENGLCRSNCLACLQPGMSLLMKLVTQIIVHWGSRMSLYLSTSWLSLYEKKIICISLLHLGLVSSNGIAWCRIMCLPPLTPISIPPEQSQGAKTRRCESIGSKTAWHLIEPVCSLFIKVQGTIRMHWSNLIYICLLSA